jgi:hypothetical protein
VLASIVVVLLPGQASATALANGFVTLTAPGSGNTVVSPLVSEVPVDVAVGPNSKMDRSTLEAAGYPSGAVPIKVLECADPGGSAANLPTKPTQCEPETVSSVAAAHDDGSFIVRNYLVLSLPNAQLGASSPTTCDMQHECVLGIFTNYNDFTKPHLFSAAFNVAPASAASGSGTSGSGSGSGAGTTSGSGGAGGSNTSNGGSSILPGQSARAGSATNSTLPAGATGSSGGLAWAGVSPLFFGLLISGLLLLVIGTVVVWAQRRQRRRV